jgi:hypothetical protein
MYFSPEQGVAILRVPGGVIKRGVFMDFLIEKLKLVMYVSLKMTVIRPRKVMT